MEMDSKAYEEPTVEVIRRNVVFYSYGLLAFWYMAAIFRLYISHK